MNDNRIRFTRTNGSPREPEAAPDDGLHLWWLGQAGFLIRCGGISLVIDPYLSDALAEKYAGTTYPHRRMMPPPMAPEELTGLDLYLSSHAHSDHMDPGLLPVAAAANPRCRFLVPEAVRSVAENRGAPADRIIGLDAGDLLEPFPGLTVRAVPAAHERVDTDAAGRHRYLGYVVRWQGLGVYHPGDCLPYPGLEDHLDGNDIHLALMPVNGRSETLAAAGIAGNFDITQALDLTRRLEIPYMIPHHFGMFAFNTVDPVALERAIRSENMERRVFPAQVGVRYGLEER